MTTERHQVVMYSREGCCLCDEAHEALVRMKDELGLDIQVRDIGGDAKLEAEYGQSIPVVFVDELLVFKGRIDPVRLRRRLKGGGILGRLSARLRLGQSFAE